MKMVRKEYTRKGRGRMKVQTAAAQLCWAMGMPRRQRKAMGSPRQQRKAMGSPRRQLGGVWLAESARRALQRCE